MIASAVMSTVIAGGMVGKVGAVDKLQISATATAGTGLSIAGDGGQTLATRSPAFLNLDVGFTHPQIPWLELAPGVMLELEGRVGFGLLPKVRAFVPWKRFRPFGLLALPVFVAPYSLLGVQGGVGLAVVIHERVALVTEGSATAYFWGSDLIDGGALGKLDLVGGVRVMF